MSHQATGDDQRKPGRKSTGGVEYRAKAWWGRFTDVHGKRFRLRLGDWPKSPQGEERAREAAAAKREQMAEVGGVEYVPPSERQRQPADPVPAERSGDGETLREYAKRWLADRTARGLSSVATDAGRLKVHVYPLLGDTPLASVTRDDGRRIVEQLDAKVAADTLSAATAGRVWGVVTKLFNDATDGKREALRVLASNPIAGVRGPDRKPRPSKQWDPLESTCRHASLSIL